MREVEYYISKDSCGKEYKTKTTTICGFDEIKKEIARLRREGIDFETFECARRTVYGRAVSALGSAGAIANRMVEAAFSGRRFGEEIELAMRVTREDVLRRLEEQLDERFSALSVVCR